MYHLLKVFTCQTLCILLVFNNVGHSVAFFSTTRRLKLSQTLNVLQSRQIKCPMTLFGSDIRGIILHHSLLMQLHWLPVKPRVMFEICLITYYSVNIVKVSLNGNRKRHYKCLLACLLIYLLTVTYLLTY